MGKYRVLDVCVIGLLVGIVGGCGGSSAPSGTPSSSSSRSESTATSEAAEAPETEPSDVAEAPVAGGWGHLKGKFVYDGTAPKAPAVQVTKDQNVCGEFGLVDESLLVKAENGGLANVVVYLYVKRGATAPEIHESYAESASTAVDLDNKNCRFEPHISLLRTSQALHVTNSDPVGHNTKIDTFDNPPSNLTIPVGGTFDQQFTSNERRPAAVSCSIHPWMKGWLIVQESPYAAVTNEDGEFEISNLPSGNWTFQFWHETAGYISEVKMGGETAKWSKGRVDIAIQPDETTDLVELKVAAAMFK